jgi:hypothetical protein
MLHFLVSQPEKIKTMSIRKTDKENLLTSRKHRGRPRTKQLRGNDLVKLINLELAKMVNLSPKTDPINMLQLAKRIGVTRQALYKHKLQQVVKEYAELQRKNFSISLIKANSRRPLEERIEVLEKELSELRILYDKLLERWVTVTENAMRNGIDPDLLFVPLEPPQRNRLIHSARNKKQN